MIICEHGRKGTRERKEGNEIYHIKREESIDLDQAMEISETYRDGKEDEI